MTEKEFAELSAGYALHALSAEDERAFTSALSEHPEWAHHLGADTAVAAALAEYAPAVQPSAAARAALLSLVAHLPQGSPQTASSGEGAGYPMAVAPASPAEAGEAAGNGFQASAASASSPVPAPVRRWGARAWFALAASVALLLGVGAGVTVVAQQLTRPAAVVALDRIEEAPDAQSASTQLPDGGEATVHWSESLGETVFVSEGLPAIEADQSYELWLVRGDDPIPAGVFAAEGGTVAALLSGRMAPGDVIAVTVEPAGGSPTGLPTGDPILAIPTA